MQGHQFSSSVIWSHKLKVEVVPGLLKTLHEQRNVCFSCVFFFFFSLTGSDGAASSYHVKQLEEQNGRLKEALVR